MRAQFFIVLLTLSMATAVAVDSPPRRWAILPVSEGPALIKQCSRGAPADVSGFWSPSASQVAAVERLLPGLARKSGHKLKLSDSRRQYIGIIVHGKKLIYLNSFLGSVLTESSQRMNWRTKAVIICDGGDAFWGVEFDPTDNTFHDIQFNGIG